MAIVGWAGSTFSCLVLGWAGRLTRSCFCIATLSLAKPTIGGSLLTGDEAEAATVIPAPSASSLPAASASSVAGFLWLDRLDAATARSLLRSLGLGGEHELLAGVSSVQAEESADGSRAAADAASASAPAASRRRRSASSEMEVESALARLRLEISSSVETLDISSTSSTSSSSTASKDACAMLEVDPSEELLPISPDGSACYLSGPIGRERLFWSILWSQN